MQVLLSNTHSKADTDIILNEKEDVIFKIRKLLIHLNEFFGSIVESLDLHIWSEGFYNVPPPYASDDYIDTIFS